MIALAGALWHAQGCGRVGYDVVDASTDASRPDAPSVDASVDDALALDAASASVDAPPVDAAEDAGADLDAGVPAITATTLTSVVGARVHDLARFTDGRLVITGRHQGGSATIFGAEVVSAAPTSFVAVEGIGGEAPIVLLLPFDGGIGVDGPLVAAATDATPGPPRDYVIVSDTTGPLDTGCGALGADDGLQAWVAFYEVVGAALVCSRLEVLTGVGEQRIRDLVASDVQQVMVVGGSESDWVSSSSAGPGGSFALRLQLDGSFVLAGTVGEIASLSAVVETSDPSGATSFAVAGRDSSGALVLTRLTALAGPDESRRLVLGGSLEANALSFDGDRVYVTGSTTRDIDFSGGAHRWAGATDSFAAAIDEATYTLLWAYGAGTASDDFFGPSVARGTDLFLFGTARGDLTGESFVARTPAVVDQFQATVVVLDALTGAERAYARPRELATFVGAVVRGGTVIAGGVSSGGGEGAIAEY